MSEQHVSRELYDAVQRGELPHQLLNAVLLPHVRSLCPTCRERLETPAGSDEPVAPSAYDHALEQAPAKVAGALDLVEELRALDEAARWCLVEEESTRFRGRAFTSALLSEARSHFPTEPGTARAWAELASEIYRLDDEEHADLEVRALAYRANARRLRDDLVGSGKAFAAARKLLVRRGVDCLATSAELDHLEASLQVDLQRSERAELLLLRALNLYRILDQTEGVVRSLITLGKLYAEQGDHEEAIATYRQVVGLPRSPEDTPFLYLCARLNLVNAHIRAGDYDGAEAHLIFDLDLQERFASPWLHLHLQWREGRIAAGRGQLEAAEVYFLEVRDGWAERGCGFDAAEVSLDLALLYLEQGCTEKLVRVTEEAVEIAANVSAPREALAALGVLADAARQRALDAAALDQAASFLRRVRTDSGT